jgi:hypothetical protein
MAHELTLGAPRLEGLILRDDAGSLYEVPCALIERYRVSVDRAAEIGAPPGAPAALPWVLHGGSYASTPGVTHHAPASGRLSGNVEPSRDGLPPQHADCTSEFS